MEHLTFSHIAWDTWNTTRGRMSAIKARQQRRLNELVAFVRINSCYYADKYRHLPDHITDVQQLPPTMKPDLLKYFDDWMTDPEVRRADVEAFVSDRSLIGHLFRGQYFVCTTSGTTVFHLPRNIYLIPYVGLVSLFFYAFLRWSGFSVINLVRHNWAWGVIGAVLLGMFTVNNILSQPASARSEGLSLAFEILWVGVVYGLIDALLLSILPVLATWGAFSALGWPEAKRTFG